MLYQILRLIIETIAGLFGSAMLLRAYMQWVRLGGRNPLSAFVFALTDRVVLPLRRMIRARGGIDWGSLVGAFMVALIAAVLLELAFSLTLGVLVIPNPLLLLAVVIVMLVKWSLYTVMILTLIYVVLIWVNPYAPMAPAVGMLVEPLLAPFRRILPRVGGLDLSPVALFLLVQIVLMLLDGAVRAIPGLV